MKAKDYQRTGRICPICEEGETYAGDDEEYCPHCYTILSDKTTYIDDRDVWEQWWDHRESYDGLYGPDRKRAIGGFEWPYLKELESKEDKIIPETA